VSALRAVTYAEGDAGLWSMTCVECPLLPHTEALGQTAPACASGIATNMQGPVLLRSCKHLEPDSFANAPDNAITVRCNYDQAPTEGR
jgi:hypothetical protein